MKVSEYPGLRVSTVIPASINCLKKAGAWAAIEPHAAHFSQMQVRAVLCERAGCLRVCRKGDLKKCGVDQDVSYYLQCFLRFGTHRGVAASDGMRPTSPARVVAAQADQHQGTWAV
jgi:hypothetical protein